MSAACPTLTVGARARAGVELGFHPKEILYYSDLSPAAAAAAPYALWLGKVFHAPVEVCQLTPKRASNNPELLKRMVERYCKSVGQLIPEAQPEWCESAFHCRRSVAVDQVIDRATTNLAGMIVSGLKPRSTFWSPCPYQLRLPLTRERQMPRSYNPRSIVLTGRDLTQGDAVGEPCLFCMCFSAGGNGAQRPYLFTSSEACWWGPTPVAVLSTVQ